MGYRYNPHFIMFIYVRLCFFYSEAIILLEQLSEAPDQKLVYDLRITLLMKKPLRLMKMILVTLML